MNILITRAERHDGYFGFEATAGKKSAVVTIGPRNISVLCLNASHRAWRGMGNWFPNVESAKGHYKSSEMKAIIDAAVEAEVASRPVANPVGAS